MRKIISYTLLLAYILTSSCGFYREAMPRLGPPIERDEEISKLELITTQPDALRTYF